MGSGLPKRCASVRIASSSTVGTSLIVSFTGPFKQVFSLQVWGMCRWLSWSCFFLSVHALLASHCLRNKNTRHWSSAWQSLHWLSLNSAASKSTSCVFIQRADILWRNIKFVLLTSWHTFTSSIIATQPCMQLERLCCVETPSVFQARPSACFLVHFSIKVNVVSGSARPFTEVSTRSILLFFLALGLPEGNHPSDYAHYRNISPCLGINYQYNCITTPFCN